jgi:hypothetical protein
MAWEWLTFSGEQLLDMIDISLPTPIPFIRVSIEGVIVGILSVVAWAIGAKASNRLVARATGSSGLAILLGFGLVPELPVWSMLIIWLAQMAALYTWRRPNRKPRRR